MNVIITGASGMVGEGVLYECLKSDNIEKVLVVGRRTCGHTGDKLEEIVIPDLANLSGLEDKLKGFDACFFCAGKSSLGMNESDYTRVTYDLTIGFAKTIYDLNNESVFIYVSGAGTDSSESGRMMWARVKGRTENELLRMGFRDAYMFRPGMIRPTKGLKNTLTAYKYLGFLYPLFKLLSPGNVTSQEAVGKAMIRCTGNETSKKILNSRDINRLAFA